MDEQEDEMPFVHDVQSPGFCVVLEPDRDRDHGPVREEGVDDWACEIYDGWTTRWGWNGNGNGNEWQNWAPRETKTTDDG